MLSDATSPPPRPPLILLVPALQGRYSYVGAQPALEVVARGTAPVSVLHHSRGERRQVEGSDPLAVVQEISATWRPVMREDMPEGFCGE